MAVDTDIRVTLKRIQSIFLCNISVWETMPSSGCLEIQFRSTRMSSTEYITILSYSLLPFLKGNNEKKIFSIRTIPEYMSVDRQYQYPIYGYLLI